MPRAGLTTVRVVEAAEALLDESRHNALTLAAVAERVGVQMPSLYKHIAGIDALQRLLSIRAKHELADVIARATAGKAGDDAVAALAHGARSWAKAHPSRYAATIRAPDPDDEEEVAANNAAVAIVLAVLAGYQLEGDIAIDAVRTFRATVHGFIDLELIGGYRRPQELDRTFELLVEMLGETFRKWRSRTVGSAQ